MAQNRRFYVKFSGAAFGIEGSTPEEAIAQVRKIAEVYASFHALEIGVDVDEQGWPIEREAK